MTSTETITTLESLINETKPCTNSCHAAGKYGHNPDEGAAWVLAAPCGAREVFFCESGWKYLQAWGRCICTTGCGGEHLVSEIDARAV